MTFTITAAKIRDYYATRNMLGGSDTLTRSEARLLSLAHSHYYGITATRQRVTVGKVREFVEWAAVHGSPVEREAVTA